MSEIRLIDKTFRELEIDGVGYFGLPRKVYGAIEQLQQENEHYKYILTEFEKWLEEQINYLGRNKESYEDYRVQILTYRYCLDKLQELKEGKK